MARRTTSRRKVSARRPSRNSSRPVARRSSRPSSARGRRTSSTRSAPRQQRIVIEFAGAAPVREGSATSIGQKVAKAPRLKPKL